MRALGLLFIATALMVAGCGGSATTTRTTAPEPPALSVYADASRVKVIEPGRRRFGLPDRLEIRRGRARVVVGIPRRRADRAVRRALAASRSRVDLPFAPLSSTIRVRPVLQVLHNDCEATALSMLLSAAGVHASQLRLQAQLPRSGPLDPEPVAGSNLLRWGDPERGFVGRADGGGTAGGFGVYEPPVRRLAARYGIRLTDLRGSSVAAVRAAVLAGHPVLAWVGLAAGPYRSWLAPDEREITVNLNEHAVVLVGAGSSYVLVDNPLSGRRERWSEALFAYRWKLLGRRALALPTD